MGKKGGIEPGIAALLTFFIPGLGQACQGRYIIAITVFPLVIVGYVLFVVPGLLLHLLAIVDAARYGR